MDALEEYCQWKEGLDEGIELTSLGLVVVYGKMVVKEWTYLRE